MTVPGMTGSRFGGGAGWVPLDISLPGHAGGLACGAWLRLAKKVPRRRSWAGSPERI